MNLQTICDFNNVLQNIHTLPNYISEKNGSYIHVKNKSEKALVTQKIAEIANQHFTEICNRPIIFSNQVDLLTNLLIGLKNYKDRLYKSKTWYQKIGYFFGCMSSQEKTIDQIRKKIAIKITSIISSEAAPSPTPQTQINTPSQKQTNPPSLKPISTSNSKQNLPLQKPPTQTVINAQPTPTLIPPKQPNAQPAPKLIPPKQPNAQPAPKLIPPKQPPVPINQPSTPIASIPKSKPQTQLPKNVKLKPIPNLTQPQLDRLAQKKIAQMEDLEKHEQKPFIQLKHYFLGILDSANFEVPNLNLNGMRFCGALHWYIQHLKSFQAHIAKNPSYTIKDRSAITDLIKQFEFCLDISLLQEINRGEHSYAMEDFEKDNPKLDKDTLRMISKDEVRNSSVRKSILKSVLKQITDLTPGERVILEGGYAISRGKEKSCGGHAVLYCIYKESNQSYKFQIINTGEGSQSHYSFTNMIRNSYQSTFGAYSNSRWIIKDMEYSNIDLNEFSQDFFNELFDLCLIDQSKKMDDIYPFFNNSFKGKKSYTGREHKAQKHGSCAHKCISATAKTLLPNKLYLNFKVWLTESEIAKTNKKLSNGDYGFLTTEQSELLINESKKILEKRRQKAKRAV